MAMRCTDLLLYLDIPPDPSKASSRETLPNPHLPAKGIKLGADRTVIIFLKHFDAAKQTLFGIGKLYVPITTKVGDLVPVINERMKWTSGTLLKLYEVRSVTHPHQHDAPIHLPSAGNQTWHDRAHETKPHAPPE